jgi:hypothetical protein
VRVHFVTHLKAMIMSTCSQQLSEYGDTVEDYNVASSEMHLKAVIEQVWRNTYRCCDRANWEAATK